MSQTKAKKTCDINKECKDESKELHSAPKTMTFLKTLLYSTSFNLTYVVIIATNLCLIAGLWYYPFQTGIYILLPYLSYTRIFSAHDTTGEGSRWRYFTRKFFLLQFMRDHLQLSFGPLPKNLIKAEQTPNAQFLIAVFPHGVASDYRVAMDGILHTVLPNICEKIRVLAASVLFVIPVVREMALWSGCINATRSVAEKAIKKGYSILVLPGGEAEQIRTIHSKERVYLRKRKGFIKLALRHDIPVVPSYVFGASDYYYTRNHLFGPRVWLQKKLGICIPLASGYFGSIFCPFPVKTTVVFGDPLKFEIKVKGSPTAEELEKAHDEFCLALQQLFDAHKKKLGYGDRELEML